MTHFQYAPLRKFAFEVLTHFGFNPENATLASDVLLAADLRGIDSHGVARLIGYIRLLEAGRAKANPEITIEHETPGTATLDGDAGLGLITGPFAMKLAIEKAKAVGTGWVAVNNSNHFGIAAYHALMAVEQDMIGFAMTNASPLVAPTHSKDRLLGTNPICCAVPAGDEPAFVADMATTTAANGKLEILQRKRADAPKGWVQTKEGQPSTDANEVQNGGALLPLGSDPEHGSHKGYCLGAMVDILSAVLSGANYGPWAPPFVAFLNPSDNPVGKGIGHFFGAMRIDAFRPANDFKAHMDNWIHTFRKANTVDGQERVLIPGDPERETEVIRKKEGIPLVPKVVEDLKGLSKRTGINFPE